MSDLKDQAKTLLMLLANAAGATFEDENLAVSVIEETFEKIQNKPKVILVGHTDQKEMAAELAAKIEALGGCHSILPISKEPIEELTLSARPVLINPVSLKDLSRNNKPPKHRKKRPYHN